jgi:hypothetical protein
MESTHHARYPRLAFVASASSLSPPIFVSIIVSSFSGVYYVLCPCGVFAPDVMDDNERDVVDIDSE